MSPSAFWLFPGSKHRLHRCRMHAGAITHVTSIVELICTWARPSGDRLVAQLSKSHLAVSLDNEEGHLDWVQLRDLCYGKIHEL